MKNLVTYFSQTGNTKQIAVAIKNEILKQTDCELKELEAVHAEDLTKIRVGWQVPWATQGQLVQILKHTDILKQNGLEAEFVGRTYGPVLNEIALANGIDVVLTADQPAAALFSKNSQRSL